MEPAKRVTCPVCGAKTVAILDMGEALESFDSSTVMGRFASLSDVIDFNSFSNLTIPEYEALVTSLNNRG